VKLFYKTVNVHSHLSTNNHPFLQIVWRKKLPSGTKPTTKVFTQATLAQSSICTVDNMQSTDTRNMHCTKELIDASAQLGYPTISIDYLKHKESACKLYSTSSMAESAKLLTALNYDRSFLVNILNKQNKNYRADQLTFTNIEKLRDSNTLCVVTAHQAIFFGGPLFIVLKALATVKLAHKLSNELKLNVVPIFWIDGDDHDFAEANHTWLLDKAGNPINISYNAALEHPDSIGNIKFEQKELFQAQQALRDALGETDFTPDVQTLFNQSYSAGRSMTEAFGLFMASLTQSLGLIYFCPTDTELKTHAIPFFKSLITMQSEFHIRENAANESIVSAGYRLQSEKKSDVTHLFFLSAQGRVPIRTGQDKFSFAQEQCTQAELLEKISTESHRFSTDVISRPLLQSYLFPVLSQVVGSSELAYLAQVNRLFSLFNLVPPYYQPRPSATFIEAHVRKIMKQNDIAFVELFGNVEEVINRVMLRSFPEELVEDSENFLSLVLQKFDALSEKTQRLEPALESYVKSLRQKIQNVVESLNDKLFATHKKKQHDTRERIYRLQNALSTNGSLQERSLNVSYFLARHGRQFINLVNEELDLDESAHQLIYFSRSTSS